MLLLVGDGPLRQELERLVDECGIRHKTHFTGYRKDVMCCFGVMDVCVIPSANEAFGLVAIEALSLGKPTLVFQDSGGLRDIISPIAPEDVVANESKLVDRLTLYYGDRSQCQALAARRAQYARQYDIRETAAGYKAIYVAVATERAD